MSGWRVFLFLLLAGLHACGEAPQESRVAPAVGLPAAAHQLTEQYIPIGQSPGIESRRVMGGDNFRSMDDRDLGTIRVRS